MAENEMVGSRRAGLGERAGLDVHGQAAVAAARPESSGAELEGKVALVTGAASGIGYATAARLRSAGAVLALLDLDEAGGAAVKRELGGLFVRVDVGQPADWERAVAEVVSELGGIHVAHLNAGVTTQEADLTAITDDQFHRVCAANIDGVFFGARAVVPAMEAAGGGSIVAPASIAGLAAFSPDPVYAMTKHAVVGLVRALAPQLITKRITINAVCPGLVDTPLLGPEARELAAAANFPLIPVADIAEAVYGLVVGSKTGQALVCQVSRPPTAYRFSGVPGPGGETAGRTPPAALAAEGEPLRR
jgi:NAD(P)-dependent dehydrogenase (short-subunit alcohol dehydrogenase family)